MGMYSSLEWTDSERVYGRYNELAGSVCLRQN